MQISLKQDEVEVAILDYVRKLGLDLTDKETNISFTNGRNGNGTTVDIDIVQKTVKELNHVVKDTTSSVGTSSSNSQQQFQSEEPNLTEEEEEAFEPDTKEVVETKSTNSLFS